MSIEARQIQETLYSYAAILNFTPSPQGLRAKFGACSVQNAQLFTDIYLPRSQNLSYIHTSTWAHSYNSTLPWYAIIVKCQRNVTAKHTYALRVKDLGLNKRE